MFLMKMTMNSCRTITSMCSVLNLWVSKFHTFGHVLCSNNLVLWLSLQKLCRGAKNSSVWRRPVEIISKKNGLASLMERKLEEVIEEEGVLKRNSNAVYLGMMKVFFFCSFFYFSIMYFIALPNFWFCSVLIRSSSRGYCRGRGTSRRRGGWGHWWRRWNGRFHCWRGWYWWEWRSC